MADGPLGPKTSACSSCAVSAALTGLLTVTVAVKILNNLTQRGNVK